jgi:hypothetical protein
MKIEAEIGIRISKEFLEEFNDFHWNATLESEKRSVAESTEFSAACWCLYLMLASAEIAQWYSVWLRAG